MTGRSSALVRPIPAAHIQCTIRTLLPTTILPPRAIVTGCNRTDSGPVLSFPVPPGVHFIIADASNQSKVRFNFRAGKTYYILHTAVTVNAPFVQINTSSFTAMTGMAEIRKDYEAWSGKPENAASYKTEREYPGY